jgi:uncharacterized damage-inducible protein DinB
MATGIASLLDEALELWQFARDGVIAELETVPDGQMDWRPVPKSRSVTELVRHIVESGLMAAGELTRPDGDFRRKPYPEIVAEYAGNVNDVHGKTALLALLRASQAQSQALFRQAGELQALQYIRRFDGIRGTRLGWLYHAVEHESYHRGQLALYVRQLGKVPALTRLIYGEG